LADGGFNERRRRQKDPVEKESGKESLLARYLADNDIGIKRFTDENDDYAFLDEDEDLSDEEVMADSPSERRVNRWKRGADEEEEEFRSDLHVIFRRKDAHVDHDHDYRKEIFLAPSFLID